MRQGVVDVVLLITDGRPTRDVDLLNATIDEIRAKGIHIIGIKCTMYCSQPFLRRVQ